jgi:hypothetical protein
MVAIDTIKCLFSHKCGIDTHSIGHQLKDLLQPFGICLQIDPFNFGDETSYSIVERVARGRWIVRWASGRFSC